MTASEGNLLTCFLTVGKEPNRFQAIRVVHFRVVDSP